MTATIVAMVLRRRTNDKYVADSGPGIRENESEKKRKLLRRASRSFRKTQADAYVREARKLREVKSRNTGRYSRREADVSSSWHEHMVVDLYS